MAFESVSMASISAGVEAFASALTGIRPAARPSTEIRTIGPLCGGDSRAYHQPMPAAPATAMKNSVRMRVTCQLRTFAGRVFDIESSERGTRTGDLSAGQREAASTEAVVFRPF